MLSLKQAVMMGLSCCTMANAFAHDNQLIKLPGTGLSVVKQATLLHPMPAEAKLNFTVWLSLRNQSALLQLAQDVYDPSSPQYHQFLTQTDYEQQFAPTATAEHTVQQYFDAYGMQTRIVNHSVRVSGTVKQIKQALHVQMNDYRLQQQLGHANATEPQVPAEIGQLISGISGLNTLPQYHANNIAKEAAQPAEKLEFLWNNFSPDANPTRTSLQGFSGAQLQTTYNLNNIPTVNGVQLNGAGQTLVVVDDCDTNTSAQILNDANQYFNANGITPFVTTGTNRNFAIVNPDGSTFTTCPSPDAFNREIALDIESSHTIAPGDNTVLVLGNHDLRQALIDVINSLIQNNFSIAGFSNATVISNSWSGAEDRDDLLEQNLALAAAAGISVDFSSGDCGDNTYTTPVDPTTGKSKCNAHAQAAVNYPSSSAYVTAVGATSLFVDSSYHYAFETVWGTVRSVNNVLTYSGGTGGGISQFYGPVSWQSGISDFTAGGYGVISSFGSLRALPDVAMLGDPDTGLLIIEGGTQIQEGGTSLACPLFSGTLVLVNQARALLNKGTPIGQAAPYLYQGNAALSASRALNLIIPPAQIISGATPPPSSSIQGTPAPASAFTIGSHTFGWDSSLTIDPEKQFWNDAVGVGSPNLPYFVLSMANR